MLLNQLKPKPGSKTERRRVGRGEGSTLGQTAGKGQKGQKCRSGDGIMNGFEGGQTPMYRRIPKRGFNNPSKIHYYPINIGVLENRFESGSEINGESLAKNGLLKKASNPFKILGDGTLKKSFKVTASKITPTAEKAITSAGGSFQKA